MTGHPSWGMTASLFMFRYHLDIPHSVRPLWTSDQLVAQTSTWQHTTLTADRHPCTGKIRTRNPSKRSAADPRLRPRGHWDRLHQMLLLPYLLTYSLNYLRTYLLTHSMEKSPSWEANWFAASPEIPRIFMEPEGSLPHSQASATCPYPGPAQSSPHTHIPPPGDPS